jgi:hypothetical protein
MCYRVDVERLDETSELGTYDNDDDNNNNMCHDGNGFFAIQ